MHNQHHGGVALPARLAWLFGVALFLQARVVATSLGGAKPDRGVVGRAMGILKAAVVVATVVAAHQQE